MTTATQPTLDGLVLPGERNESSAAERQHLRRQRELLARSIKREVPLVEELARAGWSYDDLRYETTARADRQIGAGMTLAELSRKGTRVPVVSFFTGAGGMDLGFEAAGFETVAAVEHSSLFSETLRQNHPQWIVLGPPQHSGDVSQTEEVASAVAATIGGKAKFDGVFIGGPPCQPFSIAANQRFSKSGENFKRVGFAHEKNGNLLWRFLELVERFKPRAFVVENVPGLMEIDDGEQVRSAVRQMERLGFRVTSPRVINAAHYGVPQSRLRVFIVGVRGKRAFEFPSPIQRVAAAGPVLSRSLGGAENHETRNHSAESIMRYMRLAVGQRDQLGRVDRLDPNLPSKTIIAGGVSGGGRSHLHPHIPRTLSVRESARLQTFPDSFRFAGPTARQFTQVGNAVPPVLAAQLAIELARAIG